jgi:hypothetical protein
VGLLLLLLLLLLLVLDCLSITSRSRSTSKSRGSAAASLSCGGVGRGNNQALVTFAREKPASVKVGNWRKGATMRDQGTSYLYNYVSWPIPYVKGSGILMGGKAYYAILREPARWPMLREYPGGGGSPPVAPDGRFTGDLGDPASSIMPHAGGMNVAITHFVGTRDGHVKFYRLDAADGPIRHLGDGVFPGQ